MGQVFITANASSISEVHVLFLLEKCPPFVVSSFCIFFTSSLIIQMSEYQLWGCMMLWASVWICWWTGASYITVQHGCELNAKSTLGTAHWHPNWHHMPEHKRNRTSAYSIVSLPFGSGIRIPGTSPSVEFHASCMPRHEQSEVLSRYSLSPFIVASHYVNLHLYYQIRLDAEIHDCFFFLMSVVNWMCGVMYTIVLWILFFAGWLTSYVYPLVWLLFRPNIM